MEPSKCPFCGSPAFCVKGYTDNLNAWPHGTFYRTFCGGCQVRQLFYRTEFEAIDAWNRRAAEKDAAS